MTVYYMYLNEVVSLEPWNHLEGTTDQDESPDTSCHVIGHVMSGDCSGPVVPSSDFKVLGLFQQCHTGITLFCI